MELRQIRYFLTLAQTLHFRRAAEQLFITEQPLSLQIKKLEQELGVELFERTTRSVRLTPAGEAFREAATTGLGYLEQGAETARRIHEGTEGVLRIAYQSMAMQSILPFIISAYQKRYPAVELVLLDRPDYHPAAALAEADARAVDIGVSISFAAEKNERYQVLFEDLPTIAIEKSHPLSHRASLSIQELSQEPFLTQTDEDSDTFLRGLCRQAGFEPQISARANSYLSLLGMVSAGLGITFSIHSLSHLNAKTVSYPILTGDSFHPKMIAVTPEKDPTAAATRFLEVAWEVSHTIKLGEFSPRVQADQDDGGWRQSRRLARLAAMDEVVEA